MTTHEKSKGSVDDEREIERILHDAGPRTQPSPSAMDEVRTAVEAEWRSIVAARTSARRRSWPAIAAAVAAGAIGVAVLLGRPDGPADVVATVARVTGASELRPADGPWKALGPGAKLHSGDELRTAPGSRVAVSLAGGLSLRVDERSTLALNDAHHVELTTGAVYVDAGPENSARETTLDLETPYGIVRHLGTQYEARLRHDSLVVSVREGRVDVQNDGGGVLGAAGERLTIGPRGVERSQIAPSSSDWDWAGEVTPSYAVEGRSLDEFLAWAARETGRSVEYSDASAQGAASRVILHGSVDGLTPDQALDAVLATTGARVDVEKERISVGSAR